jgi:tetratricopeptide (TPR) repeat protein
MSTLTCRLVRIVVALALSLAMLSSGDAFAQEGTREASKHFQRAVALYNEADYRAALVEFRRAYSLSPNAAVLYNVGEAEYQLQDYAGALVTFERYLTESNPLEVHRTEVESNVEVLRARVGHLTISTSPPGADVTVDDQAIGKTPFDKSILVSIGHRKIISSMPGRLPVTRYVDVAADDNVTVSLQLPAQSEAAPASQPLIATSDSGRASRSGPALRTAGWITTGTLAAGAVSFGLLALKEAGDLRTARNTFPASSGALQHDAALTSTYSAVADSLTAAALVIGGLTLFSTLSSQSPSSGQRGSTGGTTRIVLGPGSARFEGTF